MPKEQSIDVQVRGMDQYLEAAIRTEPNYGPVVARLSDPRMARLLHVAMGLVTEAGEFMDQLKRHLFYGKPLDTTNLLEELGDITWYQRIGADELESGLLAILDRNVAKLRARFPHCFTEDKAVNRDLDAERRVLEAGGCMADWGPGEKEAWDALTPEQQRAQAPLNLKRLLEAQPQPVQQYYVLTRKRDEHVGYENKCVLWWRPEGKGYTTNLDEAGLFTDADKAAGYPDPERCIYVPKEVVDACARRLRLAWWDAILDQQRGQGSGPLPGRDVTVVQTPDKTVFVKPKTHKVCPHCGGQGRKGTYCDCPAGQADRLQCERIVNRAPLDCQGPPLSAVQGKVSP